MIRRLDRVRCFVALVTPTDPHFSPSAWDQFPASGRVLRIEPCPARSIAEGIVFAHNSRQLHQPDRWAVIVRRTARLAPGDECHRRVSLFDAG